MKAIKLNNSKPCGFDVNNFDWVTIRENEAQNSEILLEFQVKDLLYLSEYETEYDSYDSIFEINVHIKNHGLYSFNTLYAGLSKYLKNTKFCKLVELSGLYDKLVFNRLNVVNVNEEHGRKIVRFTDDSYVRIVVDKNIEQLTKLFSNLNRVPDTTAEFYDEFLSLKREVAELSSQINIDNKKRKTGTS